MKFQNTSIHRSNVSNFTEKWKNQSKVQNFVFLSTFDGKFSKIYKFVYPSAPLIIPNMKALTLKKMRVYYFFMRNTHIKFQIPSKHHSEITKKLNRHTDRQAVSNMPFQLFQSWGHKNF